MYLKPDDLNQYVEDHSKSPDSLLDKLLRETKDVPYSHMISGPVVASLLRFLCHAIQAKRVLDIGTYTGYSALSMAEALGEEGSVITIDKIEENFQLALKYFDLSSNGHKITFLKGDAVDLLPKLDPGFDLIFIDADKANYDHYYEMSLKLLRSGGVIVLDNMLWYGKVLNPEDSLTEIIDQLNKKIVADERVDNVMLTQADGIQLVWKKIKNDLIV